MKKLALLVLALSLSGFTVGCSEPAKKPATPATPTTEGDKKPADGDAKPVEPAAPAEGGAKEEK